jgi:cytochrome c biogenesis protein CcmG/thiol:disulfide interchange protein DsbE
MKRTVTRIALFLVALAAGSLGAAANATSSDSLRDLLPGLKGKVVLLDFWASWCEPCRQSFPWMSELQQRYGADNFVIVAVNLDQDRKLAEQFLSATPARFRVEYDPQGVLATQFDVMSMPTSVVIDRNGQVRERHRGFRQAQRAEREASLSKLLKE